MTGTAETTGKQDVTELLTEDHHSVLELITTISSESDPKQRRDTADTVIAELVRHSVAEEMYVYPAMRDKLPDGAAIVEHDVKEHQELEEALKALEHTGPEGAEFSERVGTVEQLLRHHAGDEEKEQFPLLRQHLSKEELLDLGHKVEVAKKAAPTRPHPASPHAELFHKAVGPGVGMVDKLRDKLTGRST